MKYDEYKINSYLKSKHKKERASLLLYLKSLYKPIDGAKIIISKTLNKK